MIVLASGSPRRRELLTQAGLRFEVHPAHIPEDLRPGEEAIAYVTRLAREKAEAVFDQMSSIVAGSEERDLLVLGADTTVTIDNHILGKPESNADAARMLRLLSGRSHRVITGVSLVSGVGGAGLDRAVSTAAEATAVEFLTLSEDEIRAYVATGEPSDKAGAYAIQGLAARWIPRIHGCYFNVVGLPISLVATMLGALRPEEYGVLKSG